ncbi:MAG: hypothetical protein M3Q29_04440 [Chloroflexota bacterium]|nr:hypothetical protein [Chloroflexota bacterium]
MQDDDTPREIVVRAGDNQSQPAANVGFERVGLDLNNVIGSLQSSIEQLRQAAEGEMARLRSEHEAERTRLQAEIEQLRSQCANQDERLRGMQGQLRSVLEDYRGELEMQSRRADSARSQLERVQQIMGSLADAGAGGDQATPFRDTPGVLPVHSEGRDLPYLAQRRGRAVDGWQNPNAADTDDKTVQVGAAASAGPATGSTTQVSIKGVTGVSAMMRARKAVESLPSIQDIESRYVSDGTLYFSVRTQEEPQALASALTSLPDPQLRLLQVGDNSIDLEM